MGGLCKLKIMKFDSPWKNSFKNFCNGHIYVYCTCKITKIEKINPLILMFVTLWSSRCIQWGLGSRFLFFKFHYLTYLSRYPGYIYPCVYFKHGNPWNKWFWTCFCMKRAWIPRIVQIRCTCLGPWSVNFKIWSVRLPTSFFSNCLVDEIYWFKSYVWYFGVYICDFLRLDSSKTLKFCKCPKPVCRGRKHV